MKVLYILTIIPLVCLLPEKQLLIETKTRNTVGKAGGTSKNKASWIPPKNCKAPDGKMYCTGCSVVIDNCNICKCRDNKLEDCKMTCPDCVYGRVKEGEIYEPGHPQYGWDDFTKLPDSGFPLRGGSYLTSYIFGVSDTPWWLCHPVVIF